jgi:putative tryptophan/tyrosine transport system substrate-binding protein
MRRRDFILLGGALVALPAIQGRSQSRKTYRVGVLVNSRNVELDELIKGLRDHGYVEGQNLVLEWRFSQGDSERWSELAGELVALKVDAIVVQTTPAALAAKHATSTVPIIIPTAIDPVGAGLAASLARPGDNVTGLSMVLPEISAKGLSLLKEAVPTLNAVAVLWNAGNPANATVWQDLDATSHTMGLTLSSKPVRAPQDFAAAFAALAAMRPDGLLVLGDALVIDKVAEIAEFALRERIAVVSSLNRLTRLGGLMSYGPNIAAACRKASDYVDRVLKGKSPAELPFEQPTTFELVINLKTAKALGLTISPTLLVRADEIIE